MRSDFNVSAIRRVRKVDADHARKLRVRSWNRDDIGQVLRLFRDLVTDELGHQKSALALHRDLAHDLARSFMRQEPKVDVREAAHQLLLLDRLHARNHDLVLAQTLGQRTDFGFDLGRRRSNFRGREHVTIAIGFRECLSDLLTDSLAQDLNAALEQRDEGLSELGIKRKRARYRWLNERRNLL